MKKNFMAIASLLIAAMLLVVSCAPEANVEGKVEDGLVNASLMATASGKALTVSSTGGDLSYTITLDAKWDPNLEANSGYKMDAVVGEKTIERSSISGTIELGWISQGLWTVTVEGKRNGATVVKGSTTKYITTDDKSVVVFLGTDIASTKSTYLDFDITVNELAANNSGYKLKATIESADKRTSPVNIPVGDEKFSKTPSNNTINYKITNSETNSVVSLTPGYYKVTVQLLNGTTVIGGITRGVLVTGESKIKIMGSVSASDFAEGSLTVYEPKVTISSFTAVKNALETNTENILTTVDTSTNTYKGTVGSDSDGGCDITYTVIASKENVSAAGINVSQNPTYTWFVDGNEISGNNTNTYHKDYNAPGHKNVTCLVTYLCTVTIGESNYEFTIGNEAVASVLVKGPAVEGEVTGEATTQTQSN